ncbi:hypothetical protein SARC_12595 [Sphaeroforma arctica JP610]|uniref:Uncharacterized protein n=1 Tax=Sphaeroforma arctica JP610 TaxID=667725 RepID=A0A0L0FDL8_9EUKA|nr:hypothetical protein SARC_12595 [Sphaeroforma arctica JP610]KNC74867.1 hypothetical protein SARC_12595 [Sphaeroforma arctica JP610]|eukprot:XP_014148769.1 hypothetical protein SARC_12595 [Sphaeroforma arctica JP610]
MSYLSEVFALRYDGESLYGHPGAFGGAPASELQDLRAFLVQKADALKELDGEIKELKTACEAEHALYLAQNETCTALQTECNTSQEAYDALNAECGANQTTHLSQISILTSTGEGLEIRLAACYEAKRLLLNEKMTAEKVLSAAAERVESLESDLKVCNTTLQAEQTARTLTNTSLAECNDRENATSTKLAQVAKAFNISEHRAHDHAEKHKIALNETQTTLNETEALYTECVASLAKQAITSAAAMNDSARAVAMCHSSARLETKKVYDLHVQVQKLTDELHKVEQDSLSRCTTAAPPTKLGPPTLNLPTLKPPASVLPPDVLQEVVTAEPSPTETLEAPADKETPQVGAECEKLAKNMTKKITQELTQNKTEELTQNITVELTQKITQELTEELTEKLAEREAAVSEVEKGLFVRENAVVKRETASQKEVQALKAENMRMIFREKQLMVRAQALDETMANGPDYDIVGALKEACTPTAVVGENAGHAGKPETSQPKDDGNPYVNINAKFSIKDDGATGNFAESQERLENAEARNAELSTEVMAARETIQALEKRLRQEHMVRGVLEEGIVPLYLLRPSLLMASTDKFVWGANVFVAFTSVLLFVLALMVFGGMLGRGGMSPAEVDALVHKKTSEAQQQIQQHPQHRPSSQSGEFNSALRTPEANPAAWLQEKLDDTLAAQHQMTDDIEVLNRNLSDRDRQIAKFRDLYAEVYASIKRPSGGNGRELLAIKAQLQEVQVKLRDEKDKFQRRETTFYALDQKNQREREEVREKFENDMRDLVADVKRLEGIVEARDIRLKELESDTAALNIELEEALQKVEKSDRSLDETIEKHRVSSDELRDELSLLKAKCATFELSGGIEESAAIEALQEKSKEEVAEVRKERDECLERINNYREQRDQQATKNAAQYTLLKAEKDANMKLREDVAELTRSCEMEVKKRIVYKKIMERDLEATRAEAAQNAAELATLNNKFKATVEILERSKRETATGNSSTGFSTLPTSQRETATGNSSAGFSTLPINLSPQVPAHNRPEPSQKKNLEMSPSATARDIVGASALTTVESEVVPLSIYMRAGDTSSLMGPPPSTKSDINISPTVPTINDKAQVSAKNLPDAAESADREDETPPAVTPMFLIPLAMEKRQRSHLFPLVPKSRH